MNPQLEGIEQLEGTYPFDIRQSYRARRLNRFLWNLRLAEHRASFVADEAQACRDACLSDEEAGLVLRRDWLGMVKYGVPMFCIEKFARVQKITNLEIYAIFRGESLRLSSRQGAFPTRDRRWSDFGFIGSISKVVMAAPSGGHP